jgi:hypothetical protein
MNSRLCAVRLGLEGWGGSDPHSSLAHIAGSIPLSGWMSNCEQLWQPDLWILIDIRDSTSGKETPKPDVNGLQTLKA